jgi:plasmid stabilization system protein ParE
VLVRVSARASTRIKKIDEWWRNSRDTSDLFKDELAEACKRIARAPKQRAPYATIAGRPVWRVLLPKSEQHVYYTIDDTRSEVVVETVWGARRGGGPRF